MTNKESKTKPDKPASIAQNDGIDADTVKQNSTEQLGPLKIIKRYSNRKLYDTTVSNYVTLDQVAEYVNNGDNIKVIDNKSGKDLTTVTLAQIIFESQKKNSSLSVKLLQEIVKGNVGTISQFYQEGIGTFQETFQTTIQSVQQSVQQNVQQVVKTGVKQVSLTANKLKDVKDGLFGTFNQVIHTNGESGQNELSGLNPLSNSNAFDASGDVHNINNTNNTSQHIQTKFNLIRNAIDGLKVEIDSHVSGGSSLATKELNTLKDRLTTLENRVSARIKRNIARKQEQNHS